MIGTWVIVPLSRPENLKWVFQQYSAQEYAVKRLCIVENGAGKGACAASGFTPDLLLQTEEAHPSIARNAAIQKIRTLGENPHICCMDDDDYYGPNYVTEHVVNAKSRRITGKIMHWVRFESQKKLWLFNRERIERAVPWVSAATIGGFARDISFPVVSIGEEMVLCKKHRAAGGEVYDTGIQSYVYLRRTTQDHANDITPRHFAYHHGFTFEEFPDDLKLTHESNPGYGIKRAWNTVPQ